MIAAGLAQIGHMFLLFLQAIGMVFWFFIQSVTAILTPPFYLHAFWRQVIDIGYYSLPVVGLTAAFTGMVLALQIYVGGSRLNAEGAIATIVVIGITRELAPVMAGLMVAGRIGASIAAEIGTMKVTEQIDALTTLATPPLQYLVVPRILAGLIMLPILVFIGDIIGVLGGFLVGVYKLGFNPAVYLDNTFRYLEMVDVISGLVKASIFGFIVTFMGCYHGFHSKRGAQGVGAATTYAVVSSSIMILLFNYFITELFFTT